MDYLKSNVLTFLFEVTETKGAPTTYVIPMTAP